MRLIIFYANIQQGKKLSKRRVLIIDKLGGMKNSYDRYSEISKFDDLEIVIFSPQHWREHGIDIITSNKCDSWKIIVGKALFVGDYRKGIYCTNFFKTLKNFKPDIICLFEEPFSFFAAQTVVGRSLFSPKSKIIFYTWENIYRGFTYPFKLSFLYGVIERYTLKNSNYAICANREAKNVLIKKGFTKPIAVIPWALSLKLYKKKNNRELKRNLKLENTFVIGYVGRLLKEKGLLILLESCSKITKDYKILLIGSGPLKNELIISAEKMNMLDKVVFKEAVPAVEVANYINCMDVLVLPSLTVSSWKEQFGRVLIEAMACEVPVIGSSSGEIPHVIGDAGLVFKEGDASELKEKICLLINNETLRNDFVKKAKNRVKTKFTWQVFAENIYWVFIGVNDNER